MFKRNIGQEILDGIREIKAHKSDRKKLHVRTLTQAIRAKSKRAKIKQMNS